MIVIIPDSSNAVTLLHIQLVLRTVTALQCKLSLQNQLKKKTFNYFFLHSVMKTRTVQSSVNISQHSSIDQLRMSLKFLVPIDIKQQKI